MVRRLVELHGGRVEARSDGPAKGSEFLAWIPLLPAQAQQPDGAKQEAGAVPPRRVLVVDDVADTADMLAMLVEMEGHDVQVARSGPAALELAAACRPDVVLLDLGMPGMDGYEVARRLREQQGGDKLALIAVTGYGQHEDRERTRAAGFRHHLLKPVDVEELRRLLQETPPTADR
jgi:CheY-like chemotaxis protein